MQPRRRLLIPAVVLSVVVAVVASAATLAFAAFSDVTRFTKEINALANAGCASGTDGKFLPDDPIEREAIAVWVNRCGGRIAYSGRQNTSGLADGATVQTVSIDIDTTGGTTKQFLWITGQSAVFTNADFATYNTAAVSNVTLEIWDDDTNTRINGSYNFARFTTNDHGAVIPATVVVAVGDGTHNYSLRVNTSGVANASLNAFDSELTAAMFPFGHSGENVLTPAALSLSGSAADEEIVQGG